MKAWIVSLLLLLWCIPAQAFHLSDVRLDTELGYGHAYPLGGTEAGDLRNTEFTSVAMDASVPVWESGNFVVTQDIGLNYLHFQEPNGFGLFAFESTTLKWLAFYPITPFISARLGVGGVDVNNHWTVQSDGLLFLLEPSIGIEINDQLKIGYGLHHLSNANINPPNCGINSHFIYVVVSLPLKD